MALADRFVFAYLFFILFGIWSICCWFASDLLTKRQSNVEKLRKKATKQGAKPKNITEYKRACKIQLLYFKTGIPIILIALTAVCLVVARSAQTEYELSLLSGWLMPANEPDPPSFCSSEAKDPRALKVFMGRNEAFSSRFRYVALRVRKKDRIIIDRDENGRIALSVDILDAQGKVITTFEKGHFTVDQSNVLDMKRPDRSTLIVRDQYKNEVLNARYLNKKSLQISGLLRYPEVGVISIPQTPAVNGFCVGDAAVAINVE